MTKQVFTKNVFINLLWPAVAGNVIWAFFDLLVKTIDSKEPLIGIFSRLLLLFILFIYLIIIWRFSPALKDLNRIWVAEGIHYITIVPFAIAISRGVESLVGYVFVIYGWTAFAHLVGLWNKDSKILRFAFGSVSIFGLLQLCILTHYPFISLAYGLTIIFASILMIWLLVRSKLKPIVLKENTNHSIVAKVVFISISALFLICLILSYKGMNLGF